MRIYLLITLLVWGMATSTLHDEGGYGWRTSVLVGGIGATLWPAFVGASVAREFISAGSR